MANYIFSYTDNSNFWCDIFPKFPKVFDMFCKHVFKTDEPKTDKGVFIFITVIFFKKTKVIEELQ